MQTESDEWRQRTQGILQNTDIFFHPEKKDIMYEVACEPNGKCNTDQRSFKAYLSRWMTASTKLAPWTADYTMPKIRTSAQAAAKQCSGGPDGKTCGMKWTTDGVWDGNTGVGEQMCALEVIQSLLINDVPGPVTNATGGTSKGDYNAGAGSNKDPEQFDTITTGDKVGAGFLTTVVLIALIGGGVWMVM